GEIITTHNLYIYDDLIFLNYLFNLKNSDKDSIWLYCNETNEIFNLACKRTNIFLNNINMICSSNICDLLNIDIEKFHEFNLSQDNTITIQNILHTIQYNTTYFNIAYEVKRQNYEIYNWIYELIYKRDISFNDYKNILLKNKHYKCKNISKQTRKPMYLQLYRKGKKRKLCSIDGEENNIHVLGETQSVNLSLPTRLEVGKNDYDSIKVKTERESPNRIHHHGELSPNVKKKKGNKRTCRITGEDNDHLASSIRVKEEGKGDITNEVETDHVKKSHKWDCDETGGSKVDYPIVVIVDNFYTQKEIYNLLLSGSGDGTHADPFAKREMRKEEQQQERKQEQQQERKQKRQKQASAPSSSSPSYSTSSSRRSHSASRDSPSRGNNNRRAFSSESVSFHLPYHAIKNKAANLKYIKPHVYILCINQNYDVVYAPDNFVNHCAQKIDRINRTPERDIPADNPTGKSTNTGKEDLFEINEYCGNLEFLELFLMKVKPYRIILTKLDLGIFRNVEIYCARLFQHNVYKLHQEDCFEEVMLYEESNFMHDNIVRESPLVKNEARNVGRKREESMAGSKSTLEEENNDSFHAAVPATDQATNTKRTHCTESNGVRNFRAMEKLSAACSPVEVFLLFYKNNIFYNKYLNNVKTEKTNWLKFIENKNSIRFEIDRTVFNKNRDMFEKVIESYFLFQKKFKENKKNILNFNKILCDQFKVFQDVKWDENVENKDAFVNNLCTNFISIEEEELFMSNYKNKIKKKGYNISTTLDENTILKIQETIKNFSIDSFNLNFILYSIFNNTKPIIIVDVRELKSDLSYKLYKSNMHIIPYSLLVGDYILTKDICVERKTIVDLIQSLNNNRLYNQINQMSKYYTTYVLLIEFNNKHLFYFSSLNDKHSIYTKLIILCLQFSKLKILWSPFSLFTVKLFWSLKVNSEQPDIFKALHVDMTHQRNARREDDSAPEQSQSQSQSQSKQPRQLAQPALPHTEEPPHEGGIPNQEVETTWEGITTSDCFPPGNCAETITLINHLEEKHPQEKTYKYETINDLFDKNLKNVEKPDNDKALKRIDSVTNWNAIEILKALPGVNEKNMHHLINNITSLCNLCEKSLEELEAYMSKGNAKMLYDFLNTEVL
ncbi:DNA repair endonuclease, partial [Plasmodium ovale curtisi]